MLFLAQPNGLTISKESWYSINFMEFGNLINTGLLCATKPSVKSLKTPFSGNIGLINCAFMLGSFNSVSSVSMIGTYSKYRLILSLS